MILGSGLLQSSGWTPTWLIRDEFTDTRAAGSVNGTAATPGPGTRAVTDTGGNLSVGSGALGITAGVAAYNPRITYSQHNQAAGLALVARVAATAGRTRIGWRETAASTSETYAIEIDPAAARIALPNAVSLLNGWSPSFFSTYTIAVILRDATRGAFFAVKGGAYTNWTMLWADNIGSAATAVPLYCAITTPDAGSVDYIRVMQLPAPFDTDDGIATDTHSGSVAAGTEFTHEADMLLEFTVTTRPSADNADVLFRVQDASNYWVCRVNSSGDISLIEVVAGTPTTRGTAAGVVSSGHRVVIIADGTTVRLYSNNTLRVTYASASSGATATAGEVDALGTDGVVSNVKSWPRTLSGTAASILEKASA